MEMPTALKACFFHPCLLFGRAFVEVELFQRRASGEFCLSFLSTASWSNARSALAWQEKKSFWDFLSPGVAAPSWAAISRQ